MCIVQYYDALIDFIGHRNRDRHKYTEWGWKKNDMNLYLDIFSFIADIRPGSKYPLNFLVIIVIVIIIITIIITIVIIVIIIINIDSGSIYKYNDSSPYKL